uniref:GWxTD domain-containing protein n=1 Tax=candidate division WOR-3 bacterium TaxID=2052148 RepID=A0A7C4X9W6_UNCW3
MILFLLLSTIELQTAFNPITDSITELKAYLQIPPGDLKFVAEDSFYFARYEIQVRVFDKKGNQMAGDYWVREMEKETTTIYDSVSVKFNSIANSFHLRIIDLHAGEILSYTEKIPKMKFLANIRYRVNGDTLVLKFTVINHKKEGERITISLKEIKKEISLKPEDYEDSLSILVKDIPGGRHNLKFTIFGAKKKVSEGVFPVEISRPFFLEDRAWLIKVSQLEYIATPSEISKLKSAPVEKRDSLWKDFWKKYDPTPNTEYNEKEYEYFERIDYAEKNFCFGDKGWRSDRGRIYVKFGPPDEIQSRPYELGTKPYEIWLYYRLNLKFIFYDRYGFGEYILLNPEGERI